MEEAPAGPQWALYSTVEEVLRIEGVDATEQMTLNDFIRRYVDPNFVLEGRNVMMGVFARRPVDFISDERLLGRILNSPEYQTECQRREDARNLHADARNLHADARNLIRQGVYSLGQWKDFHQKGIVAAITRSKLNAALEVAEVLERAWRVKELPDGRCRRASTTLCSRRGGATSWGFPRAKGR
ncbi:retrotransposon hot spot (RHS) protein, partial [Trypanosoma conorhini]